MMGQRILLLLFLMLMEHRPTRDCNLHHLALAHHIRLLIEASTEQEKILKEMGVVRWMR